MNRKAISAYIIGCEPGEFMAYADLGEKGTVVVGPDGKKYRFNNEQLDGAEAARSEAHAPKPLAKAETERKPKPKPKPKSPSKAKPRNPSKAGTKRKPATKTGAKLQ